EPFPCNAFGKHGSKSAAFTHRYAVAQALSWCRVVAAVVPRTFAEEAKTDPFFAKRLHAVYHLPSGSFRQEGAEVEVSILVWGEEEAAALLEENLTGLRPLRLPDVSVTPRDRSSRDESLLSRVEER